jgi:SNF2 family DNA or RNA helicase
MRITYRNGIFVAISTIEEKAAVTEAGFSWHRGLDECPLGRSSCYACKAGLKKAWWTRRHEAAARLSAYADDDAKKSLAEHIKAVEMSRATDSDANIPTPPGLNFYGYQKAGIAYMARREGTLLGDEQGLGKTPMCIGVINLDQSVKNVLVICPARLRINWKREAERWLVDDGRRWLLHIVDEDEAVPERKNFVIVHYNRVTVGYKTCKGPCGGKKREPIQCPKCKGTGNGARHPLLCDLCQGRKFVFCKLCKGKGRMAATNLKLVESLHKRQWDLIIADEAHYLKNLQAKRTRAVLGDPFKKKTGLAELAKRRLFLTGTPIPNRPVEIWPIVASLAPKEFGNLKAFARRYCAGHEEWVSKTKKVFKFDGASNLEELQEKLRATCMIRRLKADVLKDLPPKRRQVISLPPSEEAKKLIAEELEIWERKFGDDIALVQATMEIAEETHDKQAYDASVDKLKYIQNVAFMEMARVRRQVALVKVPAIVEHLEAMIEEGVGKIIVFAHHREVIDRLAEHFKEVAVAVYGGTTMKASQLAIDNFQDAKSKVQIFIGGITAVGTGITLTASSTVVFAELDWTPGNINQAEDRAHRIGQVNSVLVQHLVLDGSLDAKMAQMIVEKQMIADRALDKDTNVAVKGLVAARPEVPVESVPLWKKVALKEALNVLAQRRDPTSEGGHGFSHHDATIGHSFATQRFPLSDKQAHIAIKLINKYRRQLSISHRRLAEQLEVYEPPEPEKPRKTPSKEKKKSPEQIELLERFSKIA